MAWRIYYNSRQLYETETYDTSCLLIDCQPVTVDSKNMTVITDTRSIGVYGCRG